MKCAIYGAGSLGTVLGAYITKSGQDIELVNRNTAHVEALQTHGAHITGTVDLTVPVHAILPAQMEGPYDVIFLMTKQQHNREVVTFLKPLLSENGVIVTLQNGLPEEGIAAIVGKEHVLGAVVEWGATLSAPGECTLTSDPSSMSFRTGKPESVDAETFDLVLSLLERMCPVYVEENLLGVRWTKFTRDRQARKLALKCIKEVVDVGHAAGAVFVPVQGKNILTFFYCDDPVKTAIAERLMPIALRKHQDIFPSMLQDILRGKPCEIDYFNGLVSEWGRKTNVPTPINDRIVRVIKNEDIGKLRPEKLNLVLFSDLL